MARGYTPDRGDLVWLDMNPQAGREQAGRRPAVVISPSSYNGKVGLALFCPVTSRIKGYPFEVVIETDGEIMGAILTDQVKSLDWRVRKVDFIERLNDQAMAEVLAKLATLVS